MLLDIRKDHLEMVQAILRKWVPDVEVWAFGSRAKWVAKDYSDLDLCLVTQKPLDFAIMGHLEEDFSESDLPYKVDLVDWATTSESFRKIMERDKVVVQKVGIGSERGSTWLRTTIGQQATLQRGFDITKAEQRPGCVPVVSSAGISSWHDTAMVKGPGVVLGRKGVVGSVHYVEQDYWPHDTSLWVKDFHGNDPKFVFYFFRSFSNELSALDVGSANPTLNRNHVHPIEVVWPLNLSEQQSISQVLGSLDSRITLLRETKATLEAIAQALFKSWFVDFDPVRAKMEGRAPEGMDEATAALFPDSFEETALGRVPKGWRVRPIGELVEAVGGSTPDTKNAAFWEPAIHNWTSPKDLSGLASPILLDTERSVSEAGLAKISSGLLPEGTLLMSSRAPIGYLAITQIPVAINQGYIAIPPGGILPPLFMLFWCRQNMEGIKGRANGSTFMEISKKAFRPIPALAPTGDVITAFINIASVLFARLVENEKQSQTIATLRDTLLPRLISGQLRVGEAVA